MLFPLTNSLTSEVIVVEAGCTLVDAMFAANLDLPVGDCSSGSGADEIRLTENVTLVQEIDNVDGPTGLPSVVTEMTVDGGGFSVVRASDAPAFRIFRVGPAGTLTIRNLTIENGRGSGCDGGGGGVLNDGGVLDMVDSVVRGNTVTCGTGGGVSNMGRDDHSDRNRDRRERNRDLLRRGVADPRRFGDSRQQLDL